MVKGKYSSAENWFSSRLFSFAVVCFFSSATIQRHLIVPERRTKCYSGKKKDWITQLLRRSWFTVSSFLKQCQINVDKEPKTVGTDLGKRENRRLINIWGGWDGGGGGNRRKPLGEIRVEFSALNCVKLSKSTAKRRDRIIMEWKRQNGIPCLTMWPYWSPFWRLLKTWTEECRIFVHDQILVQNIRSRSEPSAEHSFTVRSVHGQIGMQNIRSRSDPSAKYSFTVRSVHGQVRVLNICARSDQFTIRSIHGQICSRSDPLTVRSEYRTLFCARSDPFMVRSECRTLFCARSDPFTVRSVHRQIRVQNIRARSDPSAEHSFTVRSECRTFVHGQIRLVLWRKSGLCAIFIFPLGWIKYIVIACIHSVPISPAPKQHPARLQGKWMHSQLLINTQRVSIVCLCSSWRGSAHSAAQRSAAKETFISEGCNKHGCVLKL